MKEIDRGAGESAPSRRTLYVMRHADAEFNAGSDHERPLSVQGRVQATSVGRAIAALGPVPEVVLCSSALRTRTTKDLLMAQWSELAQDIEVQILDELYEARPREVLNLIQNLASDIRTALMVGHEPVTSMLSALLAGPESDSGAMHLAQVGFMTAGVAVLEFESPWGELEPRGATLTEVRAPKPSRALNSAVP